MNTLAESLYRNMSVILSNFGYASFTVDCSELAIVQLQVQKATIQLPVIEW